MDYFKTQPPVDHRFRPVPAGFCFSKQWNRPEPEGTAGQPAVGFWSRPSLRRVKLSGWHTTPVARRVGLVLEHFPFTNAASQWLYVNLVCWFHIRLGRFSPGTPVSSYTLKSESYQ